MFSVLGWGSHSGGPDSLLTDLVAWWSLDEESGTRYDSHASYDLTDNNTVGYISGKQGNAADFVHANDEYLSAADISAPWSANSDMTIAAWIKIDTSNNDAARAWLALTWGIAPSSNLGELAVGAESGGNPKYPFFIIRDTVNSAWINAVSSTVLVHDTWALIIGEWDSAARTARIYVNNGAPAEATGAAGAAHNSVAEDFAVGAESYDPSNNAYHNDDSKDEIAIWARKLTSDERSRLYASGAGLSYADIQSTFWSYASLAAAESSGDSWQDGDDVVIVGGAHFVYKSELAVDGYSGLIHKYPYDGSGTLGTLTATSLKVSEAANSDPDDWQGAGATEWEDVSSGVQDTDYTLDTSGGLSRIQTIPIAISGTARLITNKKVTSADTESFGIIDDLSAVTLSTVSTDRFLATFQVQVYDDGVNRSWIALCASADNSTVNWRLNHTSFSTFIESTIDRRNANRAFLYVKAGRWAVWFNDEATPHLSGSVPRSAADNGDQELAAHQVGRIADANVTTLLLGSAVYGTFTSS
jgi:hypothetical protein